MTFTEKATSKLEELDPSEPLNDYVLYIKIEAGGCSGLNYKMNWINDIPSDWEIKETSSCDKVILWTTDKRSSLYLENVTLDYEDGLNGKGFTWTNTAAKRTCGCGSSFST